ncbi:MAG: efflux RND transporter periplasmic adaptor subunit [Acidobacteriota bacterium]
MKKVIFGFVVVGVLALVGWRLYEELSAEADPGRPGPPMAPRAALLVETAQAVPHTFGSRFEAPGELRPRRSVQVMSRISGYLREVNVERGDVVRAGDLVAVVEDLNLVQQIERAEAGIEVARATVLREEATLRNLEVQVRRYRTLRAANLVSEQELEDLESRLRAAEASLALAQAQVRQAEAALRELQVQHAQTKIYASLDGIVEERFVDPGALVGPSTPIVSIVEVARLKTVVPVSEEIIPLLQPGVTANIEVPALARTTIQGQVTRISPVVATETRAADVEIELENPGRRLLPGMFVKVGLEVGRARHSLAIPRAALLTRGEQHGVYLITADMRTAFQPVEIGTIEGDLVEVLSGLEEGTTVVTTGAQILNDGDLVRIR